MNRKSHSQISRSMMQWLWEYFRNFAVLALLFVAALAAPTMAQASDGPSNCQAMNVPVNVPDVTNATLYGELCIPPGQPVDTVLFLVHGSSYDHNYWDWPEKSNKYSFVRAATRAKYATFNIDRLGVGKSTFPPSSLVTLDNTVDTLHQIVTKLRNGEIGGQPFSRVVYFGNSLSTAYGWVLASRYENDIDSFVLTGLTHFTKPSFLGQVQQNTWSACQDPKFAGTVPDCAYITTVPGSKGGFFYYLPNADPDVIALDDELRALVSVTLIMESIPLVTLPPPETDPARAIKVPTLLAIGEFDGTTCGAPDGLDCTEANIRALEEPYYSPEAQLQVYVVPDTGHALPLHYSGRDSTDFIIDWLDAKLN